MSTTNSQWYSDANNGKDLDPEKVKAARRDEIDGFVKRQVYEARPRAEAVEADIKPIGVRWVDVEQNSGVRSRFVCQDFNPEKGRKKHVEEAFAPTPPLLASRWLLSQAASEGDYGRGTKRIMCVDFTKAFLYGRMTRKVYIELPPEDQRRALGQVGLLHRAMYGLRDAPAIWQGVVLSLLNEGFKAIVTSKCVYYNKDLDITIVAHVDDFLCYGEKAR